jgi:hypothetical protein
LKDNSHAQSGKICLVFRTPLFFDASSCSGSLELTLKQPIMTTFKNYPLHGGIVLLFLLQVGCSEDLGLKAPTSQTFDAGSMPLADATRQGGIDLTAFRALAAQSAAVSMVDADRFFVPYGKYYLYYNYERMLRERAWSLTDDFSMSRLDVPALARNIELAKLAATYPSSPLPGQISGASSVFSSTQISILNSYCSRMYGARNATDAAIFYTTTKNGVNTSTSLTRDQKIVLLSVIEVGNEFAKKFFAGAWSGIRRDVEEATGASVSGCTVDWRGVWAGGVVGGVVGAVFGAKAGAAGGTVAFPGLGTATGALGGGVIGFATGFIGGVGTAIAGQLLTTCFRSPNQSPDIILYCERLPEYLREPFDRCSMELLDHKVFFSIRDLIG